MCGYRTVLIWDGEELGGPGQFFAFSASPGQGKHLRRAFRVPQAACASLRTWQGMICF